ncbi:hypothetical protein LWI29_003013 [Acer saccharum]|uniref:Alkyl transferase n=1 Tax=Acer saccharum TaxID=4024 RepID=A0AA39VXP0_ACESA|nr:hypothetical protein LWI29_003013 [Acer saccharum]KAK1576380.1 hypothetical protein Q3G72_013389 [Acer saccharum]
MRRYGDGGTADQLFCSLGSVMRRCLFRFLSVGPIPNHLAFIMDGNRRYSKKKNLEEGAGHRDGFSSLMSILNYCYELGVKYVTIYAFSIENFKRQPSEVQNLMDLLLDKINGLLKEQSIVNQYGIRVYFIGNLKLLSEPVRVAAEKAMMATADNTNAVLLVCVAYTSGDEIVHAIQYSCKQKLDKACNGVMKGSCDDKDEAEAEASKACRIEQKEKIQGEHPITMNSVDIEKHMYMSVAPDPDVLIRSSGETRLSNFLLWQTNNCLLYSPAALWPEIGLWHLVWAVLNFQRNHSYLEKKKKQS